MEGAMGNESEDIDESGDALIFLLLSSVELFMGSISTIKTWGTGSSAFFRSSNSIDISTHNFLKLVITSQYPVLRVIPSCTSTASTTGPISVVNFSLISAGFVSLLRTLRSACMVAVQEA